MPRPTPSRPRATSAPAAAPVADENSLRFGPLNGIVLGAGLACIVGGFMLLASASTVAAPILLVLGFAVLVPVGIIL